MTRDEWWKEFSKVMRKMPASAEVVVAGSGRVDLYPAGSLRRH